MNKIAFVVAMAFFAAACGSESAPADENDDYEFNSELETPEEINGASGAVDTQTGPEQSAKRPAARGDVGKLPPGAVRVKRVEIVDRNGFEKPMVATTVLIPADWRTEGGIVWGGGACGPGYNVDYQAMSPDGRSGVHFFQMEQWQWNSMGAADPNGCPTMQITSVRQYLDNLISRARPGAQMLDYRRRPDIEEQFSHFNQTTPMPLGESRTWIEAAQALIGYNQDGVAMQETIAVAVVFNLMRNQPMAGVPGSDFLSGSTLPGFAMRAPEGRLDAKLAEMIRNSGRENPAWAARIAQHNAKIAGIQIQGARDRSRIIAQTGEEIRQMQADSWRQYNESTDRMARETSEAIRGVETYKDPYYGDTVQLDHTYENAWQLEDGTYVLSNDAFFDPYKDLGVNAVKLEVAE